MTICGPDDRGSARSNCVSKVVSAAAAAALIGDGMVVSVSSSSGLGCPDAVLAAIGERFDAEGAAARHHDAASDRRRRHVRHQGHRPPRQAGPAQEDAVRLLSVRPVEFRAAADLEDDRRQFGRGLQRPVRHPVRHASRGRRQAAGRADQGRARHLRRSAPPGLRHERRGQRADRLGAAIRRRGMAVFPFDRAERRDHPRHHRRRARQPHL